MAKSLSRRALLTRSLVLGCSAAASPLITPVTLAAAPWDQRLVVIILRGAMDGLDVVQPYGDPELAANRTTLKVGEAGGAHDLDGFFALHPGLSDLMPLWDNGELGFAHAVATPYRDKRSHFDGQDLLEAGTGFDTGVASIRDGWLNRMLQTVPGLTAETAYAIGESNLLILTGAAEVSSWSPGARLDLSSQGRELLAMVARGDPLFNHAVGEAIDIVASLEADTGTKTNGAMQSAKSGKNHTGIASFAANRLLADTRIAAFSINGWDTHHKQKSALKRPLSKLSETLLALRDGLGPVWDRTTVVAMTEFGRTMRENGTGGTDHGTGGVMLLAGGAVRGGRVYGDWPGLGGSDLYKGRDLMPTADVRAYAASAMRGLLGIDRSVLENAVFPGLDMAGVANLIR